MPYFQILALLQHGADANVRNTEGKTALELADAATRPVLEAARSGAEDRLLTMLNSLNVNCHASDGRRSIPLHLAAGYNRNPVVQILLQHAADFHAKDKVCEF
jgi:tankyrase